jgi:hypothetical protein
MAPSKGFDWWRLVPIYWWQNEPTNREWDAMLNRLLDEHSPVKGYCTARLGPVDVWASNWPYAYGSAWRPVERDGLPMVRTRRRLRKMLEAQDYAPIRAAIAKATAARQSNDMEGEGR